PPRSTLFPYTTLFRSLPFLPGTTTPLPGFGQFSKTKIYQYTVSETHIFNEHMLNELKVGYNRFNFDAVEPSNVVASSSLGFTGIVPQITKSQSAPRIDVTGLFTLGFSDNGPQPRIDDTGQLLDNVSYTTGKHAYKWGVDIRRGHVANPFGFENNGAFGFSGSGPFSTGNPGSDFLLGIPDTYGQSSGSFIDASAWEYYSFIQDQWRLRPNPISERQVGTQSPLILNEGVLLLHSGSMETASQPDVHLWDWLANRHAADGPLQSWRGDQRLPTESAVNSLPYGPDGTGLPGRPRDHFGGL